MPLPKYIGAYVSLVIHDTFSCKYYLNHNCISLNTIQNGMFGNMRITILDNSLYMYLYDKSDWNQAP